MGEVKHLSPLHTFLLWVYVWAAVQLWSKQTLIKIQLTQNNAFLPELNESLD